MISWKKLAENRWIVQRKDKNYPIDSLEKLFVYCFSFGIELDEIEFGVLEMDKNDHNYAEFGNEKTFLFSERR